jgi:hypothetical protein
MVESLWSLANGITSFAVLQALAFLYALGREDFVKAITNPIAQRVIVSATIAFTIGYCIAAWMCWTLASDFDCHHKVWSAVTWGRIACIMAFNLMVLGIDLAIARTRGVRRILRAGGGRSTAARS